MNATLYSGRYVLPITAPPIVDGAFLVADGKIMTIGPRRQVVSHYPNAEKVDFGDAVLLPPMVNTHTHLELSGFPDWQNVTGEVTRPESFVGWILQLVRVRRTVTVDQLRNALNVGMKSSLAAGTGAVGDILTTLEIADAYRQTPLAGQVFVEVLGRESEAVASRLDQLASALNDSPGGKLCWGVSPHAPYTLSAKTLDRVFAFGKQHVLQSCIHLAESTEECAFLEHGKGPVAEQLYKAAQWDTHQDPPPGCSPVQLLCRQGRLKWGDLVIHGVQVNNDDIELLRQTGCHVVLCPRSNAELGVGKAPMMNYLQAGVPLALGTDSLASAPSLSIWDELAFAQKWFPAVEPSKWLEIATLGGATALRQGRQMGSLAEGHAASFQVVTLPSLPAIKDLEESLCHVGQGASVTHLYLSGQNVLP